MLRSAIPVTIQPTYLILNNEGKGYGIVISVYLSMCVSNKSQ
jgi:hypothetical protein